MKLLSKQNILCSRGFWQRTKSWWTTDTNHKISARSLPLFTLSPVHTGATVAETGDKSATKSTVAIMVDFLADMFNFVARFGNKSASTWIWQLVVFSFVADTVNFVASVYTAKATRSDPTVLNSTLSPVYTRPKRHGPVRPCWIQLCCQCGWPRRGHESMTPLLLLSLTKVFLSRWNSVLLSHGTSYESGFCRTSYRYLLTSIQLNNCLQPVITLSQWHFYWRPLYTAAGKEYLTKRQFIFRHVGSSAFSQL